MLTEIQAQEIIDKFISGIGTTQLAAEYDIWETTVGMVLRGDHWKQCKRPNNIKEILHNQQRLRSGKKCKVLSPLTDIQKDIIIGSLLGDGTVSKIKLRANSRFTKSQMLTKKSYLDWHFQQLNPYSQRFYDIISKEKLFTQKDGTIGRKTDKERVIGCGFDTCRHPNITELRKKWYPEGIKKVPIDLELNPQRIAIWFFDDGTNNVKQRHVCLCTNAFTFEEVEFLSKKLNNFDLFAKIETQKSKYTGIGQPVLKFYSKSYDNLINLIKPYMLWDCLVYKVQWRPALKQHEVSGHFTDEQVKEICELRRTKTAKEIAKQYNVHVNFIYELVSGRTYKHVKRDIIYAKRKIISQ